MLSRIYSLSLIGLEVYPIEIEIDVAQGLPVVAVVGLADTAGKESKDRVKSAIRNCGYKYPQERMTINLAPADVKKEGPSFDLPIALGILATTGQINPKSLEEYFFLGELALDGKVRPVKGALSIAMYLCQKRRRKLILPQENANEAGIVEGIEVYPVNSLVEAIGFLSGDIPIPRHKASLTTLSQVVLNYDVDFSEVKGQYSAKRALEVAAAGSHNILMIGPPGAGKTMLAKRFPTILPEMTQEEVLETTRIYSAAGLLAANQALVRERPFRCVHHTSSDISLVGGSSMPKPGEISLAHNGVLFLDEFPEFRRQTLEALRQPLEDGYVVVSRINRTAKFSSRFLLVASMNPCPCGLLGNLKSNCRCSTTQVHKYRSKISGPLLDRIDIHIEVPSARYQELSGDLPAESSVQIKERVGRSRLLQRERLRAENIMCNARMNHKQVRKFCALGKEENELLKMAMNELNFSARAYGKILKVARTIADLAGCADIKTEHLSEAIQYRSLDREFFV